METNERQIMNTLYRATERQWGIVRRRAENDDATDSALLELADRLTALEKDSLELARTAARAGIDHEQRITALEAAASPPPAADHFRGAPGMVGGYERPTRQEEPPAPSPTYEPTPPPAPTGGVVQLVTESHVQCSPEIACAAILAVAHWLDARCNNGSAAELRQEVDR